MRIGLCDDEQAVHVFVSERVDAADTLLHYYSAAELLNAAEELDCLLLDIEMPEMDGIAAARELNRRGIPYRIIMLTGKRERFKEAFEINAFRFVTKPIEEEELRRALFDVQNSMLGMEYVSVYQSNCPCRIRQRDIVFLMASQSSTILYTAGEQYRSELPLSRWENMLEEKLFYKCHKSYIVNLSAIEAIERSVIKLKTGDKVEVSRRKYRELQEKYMRYDTRYRG